jgi:hypothetical protein
MSTKPVTFLITGGELRVEIRRANCKKPLSGTSHTRPHRIIHAAALSSSDSRAERNSLCVCSNLKELFGGPCDYR